MKLVIIRLVLLLSLVTKWSDGACTCLTKDDYIGYFPCGSRISGCDATTLYYCPNKNNATTKAVVVGKCDGSCQTTGDQADTCANCNCGGIGRSCTCRYKGGNKKCTGDGCKKPEGNDKNVFCGSRFTTSKCAPDALYSCGGGEIGVEQKCTGKCVLGEMSGQDRCDSCKCTDQGNFCGFNVGCARKYLYTCAGKDAIPVFKKKCLYGCSDALNECG